MTTKGETEPRPVLQVTAWNLEQDEDNPVGEDGMKLDDWDQDEFLFIGQLLDTCVEVRITRKEVELMLRLPMDHVPKPK